MQGAEEVSEESVGESAGAGDNPMKEVMPGVYSRSADQTAFLEEIKRYNAQLLDEHKKMLEQQFQSTQLD